MAARTSRVRAAGALVLVPLALLLGACPGDAVGEADAVGDIAPPVDSAARDVPLPHPIKQDEVFAWRAWCDPCP